MTKEVVQSIGYESFVNPIVAHLRLVQSKWRISRHCAIDVITPNKFRPTEHAAYGTGLSQSEKRMIGDHIEAVAERIVGSDERGGYCDGNRKRDSVYHTLDFEDFIKDGALHLICIRESNYRSLLLYKMKRNNWKRYRRASQD